MTTLFLLNIGISSKAGMTVVLEAKISIFQWDEVLYFLKWKYYLKYSK